MRSPEARARAVICVTLLRVAACRSAPSATPSSPLAPLRVTVRAGFRTNAPPTPATLAVAWFTADEWRALDRDHAIKPLLDMMPRIRTVRVRVGNDRDVAEVSLDAPADAAVAYAVLDTRGRFFDTLLGRVGGNATGHAEVAARRATLTLDALAEEPPRPERCVGERYRLVTIDAPEVRGALDNPTQRRLCVRLPNTYASEPARRYPVIYVLPGIRGTDATVTGDFGAIADDVGREALYVGVDTSNNAGSTYFVDSPVSGAWARFLFERVVPHVDANFRTMGDASSRGVVGHSTGGFNAVSVAFRRPDVFSAVGASSPDALDMATWFLGADGRADPLWLGWMRVDDAVGGPGQMTSYAADWSPDARAPRGFAWPFDLTTGAVVPEAWSRWLDASPIAWLSREDGLARARRLSGRIYLTCGRRDEARLFAPAERFAEALSHAGVARIWVPTEYTHLGQRRERLLPILQHLTSVLAPAR